MDRRTKHQVAVYCIQNKQRLSFLPHGDIPHAERGEVGRVVDLGEVRRPLPPQHVPVLGLRPRVEPQDVVLHHAGVRRHARPAVLVHRRAEGGRLRDERARAGAVEAPSVVRALEPSLAVDAALRQRREAVRAGVLEHAPLAGAAVVPGDDAESQHHLAVRRPRVEVAYRGDRVPLV